MLALCCCLPRRISSFPRSNESEVSLPDLACHQEDGNSASPRHLGITVPPPSLCSLEKSPSTSHHPEASLSLTPVITGGNSDSEPDNDNADAKRLPGALKIIKTKIIRHISQSSSSSRILIGHSEGEVARRVELKRFMRRRIQEELNSSGQRQDGSSDISNLSHRYLAPLIDLPACGPRDGIEFSVKNTTLASDADQYDVLETDTVGIGVLEPRSIQCKTSKRRRSCPDTVQFMGSRRSMCNIALADRISLPNLVSTIGVSLGRLSSLCGKTSSESWRACPNPAESRGVVEPASQVLPSPDSQSQDGFCALGMWLVAQGLRSRDQSFSHCESIRGHSLTRDRSISVNGMNGTKREQPSYVYEAELEIPDCLSSSASVQARPMRAVNLLNDQEISCTEDEVQSHPETIQQPTSQDLPKKFETDKLPLSRSGEASSSIYPSMRSSADPSPSDSHPEDSQFALDEDTIRSLQLAPVQWLGDIPFSIEQAQSDGLVSDQTFIDHDSPGHAQMTSFDCSGNVTQVTIESSSFMISETTSYRDRETELTSVEKRFAEALLLRKPQLHTVSRFKEVFIENPRGSRHTSLFSKLHLAVPRRSKWSGSKQHRAPVTDRESWIDLHHKLDASHSQPSPYPNGTANHGNKAEYNSKADLWQRALKSEATTLDFEFDKTDNKNKSYGHINSLNMATSTSEYADDSPRGCPQSIDSLALKSQEALQEQLASCTLECKPQAEKRVIRMSRNPPESMSKIRMGLRAVQSGATDFSNGAASRDFALRSISSDGIELWLANSGGSEKPVDTRNISRVSSGRLGRAVKSGLSKLRRSKSGPGSDAQLGPLHHPDCVQREPETPLAGHQGLLQLEQRIEYLTRAQHLANMPTEAGIHFGSNDTKSDLPLISCDPQTANESVSKSNNKKTLLGTSSTLPTLPQDISWHLQARRESMATSSSDLFVTPISSAGRPYAKAQSISEESGKSSHSTVVIRRAESVGCETPGLPIWNWRLNESVKEMTKAA